MFPSRFVLVSKQTSDLSRRRTTSAYNEYGNQNGSNNVSFNLYLQKQFEQLWSRSPSRQLLLIFTSGMEIMQAKQVSKTAAGDTYFGFRLASSGQKGI